jgi:hypothetical protein
LAHATSLRIPPQGGAVRHESAEALQVTGHQLVERVEDRGEPKEAKGAADRGSNPDLTQKLNAAALVTRHERAVAKHQPPALNASVLGNTGEKLLRLLISEWEEREPLAPVESGDDPRRPAAEPSASSVEQHRAREPDTHTSFSRTLHHASITNSETPENPAGKQNPPSLLRALTPPSRKDRPSMFRAQLGSNRLDYQIWEEMDASAAAVWEA